MGYDVTQVQKSLGGFQYPGSPEQLADHAKEKGADDQLVETLRGLGKDQPSVASARTSSTARTPSWSS